MSLTAVGTVLTGKAINDRELQANYLGTHPASATIEVQGTLSARINADESDSWRQLLLFVIHQDDSLRVATFTVERGVWPPATDQLFMERDALGLMDAHVDQTVIVKAPNGTPQAMRIAGSVHDPGLSPATEGHPDPTPVRASPSNADGHPAVHVSHLWPCDAGAQCHPDGRHVEPDADSADSTDRCFEVPVLVALVPLLQTSRMTVRAAIDDRGIDGSSSGDSILNWLSTVRWLDRSFLAAVRNIFRRKGRLVLSVMLLTVAGAMFTGGINTATALQVATDEGVAIQGYDVEVQLNNPESAQKLDSLIGSVDGVAHAESWPMLPVATPMNDAGIDLVTTYPDKGHKSFTLEAPPSDSQLTNYPLMSRRWLPTG